MAFKIPEMVQETTDTTSTLDYVLSGAVSGFRSFANELSDGDVTLYCVFDTSSPPIYEINRGTYTLATTTLARTSLLRSSTGVAINWGASTKNVVAGIPGIVMQELLNKISGGSTGLVELTSSSPISLITTQTISSLGRTLITSVTPASVRSTLDAQQDVFTTRGDLVYANATPAAARLALGTSGKYLRSDGTDPGWSQIPGTEVTYSATSPLTASTVSAALDQLAHAYSKTAQSAAQANFGTSLVAVSDLDNLTPPGSPDGTKVYRVSGQVSIDPTGAGGNISVTVHLGTNGTVNDAVIAKAYEYVSAGTTYLTVHIPPITFTPSASQKITIGVTMPASANNDIKTGTGETFVVIEQISNA